MENSKIELYIGSGGAVYKTECIERIVWETTRNGSPARLGFVIRSDDAIPLTEGNEVKLICDGAGVFYGYVFLIERKNNGRVSAVAYDQLRYLKNKDSYAYQSMTAGELLKTIAADYGLKTGEICDTGYRIPSRIECGLTLFDIIGNALEITKSNTGREFVMYDDCGRIVLCEPEKLRSDILIGEENAESFELRSTIDSGVYNKIKISRTRENCTVFDTAEDSKSIERLGILQYFRSADKTAEAASLLELYDKTNCALFIKNACGDVSVRGGSAVAVEADFKDTVLKKYVLVEQAKHEFRNGLHLMSLDCRLNLQ